MKKSKILPDVHGERPEIKVALSRVGVSSVKMPIGYLSFEKKPVIILPVFDAYIDVPTNIKGMHASRNYEVIMEVLKRKQGRKYRLEDVCESIVKELLNRHEYATKAEVKATGEVIFKRFTPNTRIGTHETCDILAKAVALKKDGKISVKKSVGVGVVGLTACPCAQEVLRDISERDLLEENDIDSKSAKGVLDHIPLGTHMQRAYGFLLTEVSDGAKVDAKELVEIVENSLSSPTYGLLKRIDEAELVKRALSTPRFAEDCVRQMTSNFLEAFPNLPDDIHVNFSVKSFESIHKHDFVAEMDSTLGDLRRQLN